MTDIADSISTNAQGPLEVQGDEGRMKQHPLPDQIAADEYLRNRKAMRRRRLPFRLTKITPGGTA